LVFCTFINPSIAQETDPSILTIDRIFNSTEFDNQPFGPALWMDDGESYTTLESSEKFPEFLEIIKYENQSGKRTVLVSADRIIPQGQQFPLEISNYQWSNDKQKLLIFTNTKRVWRIHTRGDYWVLNLENWKLRQIGTEFEESSLMFAKLSPDDNRVAFVSKHNIYIENINTGKIITLTTNGSERMINGTFDWAYEEEFRSRDGFQWSPDGKDIAYWQIDASEIKDFLMINTTDSLYPFNVPVQYPKVGEDPSSAKIGIINAIGGETKWLPIPGDKKQNYIPRMMWSPDSKKLLVQQIPRKQNTNRIWVYDLSSKEMKNIFTDKDETWVSVVNDWIWLKNGKEFSWLSEKDGWSHFFRISEKSGEEILVTNGDYDVVNIVEIDDKNGYVYFIASPKNPTQRYLYRVNLSGSGKLQRLTPEDQPGTHSYQVAPSGKYAFHTYSNANTPPVIDLVTLPNHEMIRVLADNKSVIDKVSNITKSDIEFFKVTTQDKVEMDGYLIRPPDFDNSKKYPVLFYVYGEPAGQTAKDVWGGQRTLWHMMLAQKGYLVITMDNRGTPSPKGRAWRKSIFRNIGKINVRDQAMAALEVLKWDFIDSERVATWGWSGGGSMTLNLLFQYPEIYKTGMSVAPVANQLYYDNIYQERYMGVPWETKQDFIDGSPITYAKNLKGDLLLVHGTGDDNVHYQNSEALVNELIKHNKQFQLMAYPNRTHSIKEGENTRRHLYGLLTKYLEEHIKPGGEPILKIKSK